jgi:hypothetical protein
MKFAAERPYADPEKTARRIMDHARAFEPIQDGRIYVEEINRPMLDKDGATPAGYWVGLQFAIERGCGSNITPAEPTSGSCNSDSNASGNPALPSSPTGR